MSIIIPTYNRANVLVEAMDSVFHQTYRPIELIVVDDGSVDKTLEAVLQWEKTHVTDAKDFRVKYIYQENGGAPSARNQGIMASCGQFLQFLDSDDLLHPDNVNRIVDTFKETSCDYVITGFDRFCSKCNKTIYSHIPNTSADPLLLLCKNRLYTNGLQYGWKRDFIREVGPWDTGLIVFQDYDFIIRAILKSKNAQFIEEILAHARSGDARPRISDVRESRRGYECYFKATKKFCDAIQPMNIPWKAKKRLIKKINKKALEIYFEYPDLSIKIGGLANAINNNPLNPAKISQHLFGRSENKSVASFLRMLFFTYRIWNFLLLKKKNYKNHEICSCHQ